MSPTFRRRMLPSPHLYTPSIGGGDRRIPSIYKREIVREEVARLMHLAVPITVAVFLEFIPPTIMSMMISQAAGQDSKVVIAAGNLSDFIQGLVPLNIVMGLGIAITTLCAQAYGADHHEQFWLLVQAGMVTCIYSIVPVSILSFTSGPLLELMGQKAQLATIAQKFVLIGFGTYPFLFVFTIVRSALQAQNVVLPFIFASLFASMISLPLGYVLGAYTPLGYIGVALSSIVSAVIKTFVMLPVVFKNESYRKAWPGWQWRQAHELMCIHWRVGVGSVLMTAFQSAGLMIMPVLCGYLPHASLVMAANGISSAFIAFAFVPTMGVSSAGIVRIGHALGNNEPQRARLVAVLTLAGQVIVSVFGIALCGMLARQYASAYTSDKDILHLATSLSYYLLPLIPLVAIAGAAQTVFQACNAQWLCAIFNLVFLLVISSGVGLLCAISLHGGLRGLWNGQIIGFTGLILASAVWYMRLDWNEKAYEASHYQRNHLDSKVEQAELSVFASTPELGSVVFLGDHRLSSSFSDTQSD